jgi:hypothetical protein
VNLPHFSWPTVTVWSNRRDRSLCRRTCLSIFNNRIMIFINDYCQQWGISAVTGKWWHEVVAMNRTSVLKHVLNAVRNADVISAESESQHFISQVFSTWYQVDSLLMLSIWRIEELSPWKKTQWDFFWTEHATTCVANATEWIAFIRCGECHLSTKWFICCLRTIATKSVCCSKRTRKCVTMNFNSGQG